MTIHAQLRTTWLECLVCFGMALALATLGMAVVACAIIVWEMLT